jgi:hypothetical protein
MQSKQINLSLMERRILPYNSRKKKSLHNTFKHFASISFFKLQETSYEKYVHVLSCI